MTTKIQKQQKFIDECIFVFTTVEDIGSARTSSKLYLCIQMTAVQKHTQRMLICIRLRFYKCDLVLKNRLESTRVEFLKVIQQTWFQ